MADVTVVGGGLAGVECAWQLARRGASVRLVEQKPVRRTPAQSTDLLAELVCSNSLRGAAISNAVGLLKEELRRAGSLVLEVAGRTAVPAGGALAVDRTRFGEEITAAVAGEPRIERVAREVTEIPSRGPTVLATGPLTGEPLAADLARVVGETGLAYYDAIAPIVAAESIDRSIAFPASRYDKGGDAAYLNCPFDEDEYRAFVRALDLAEKVAPRAFEDVRYFEGCLPIEVMAARGERTLAFGPMKPVGLVDPRTGRRPFAVLQLRVEDADATAYNLVGCQTRMTWPEQRRVFGLVPGLGRAEFLRYGTLHRNTFVRAPAVLDDTMQLVARPGVYLAGQLTGVEGYVESAASGLVVGRIVAARLRGATPVLPPATTALGALLRYVRRPCSDFQPSNVLWSMFPPIGVRAAKRERHEALAGRALADLEPWLRAEDGAEASRRPTLAP